MFERVNEQTDGYIKLSQSLPSLIYFLSLFHTRSATLERGVDSLLARRRQSLGRVQSVNEYKDGNPPNSPTANLPRDDLQDFQSNKQSTE